MFLDHRPYHLLEDTTQIYHVFNERAAALEAMHCASKEKVQVQEGRGFHSRARGDQWRPRCCFIWPLKTAPPTLREGQVNSVLGNDRRSGVGYCQRQLGDMFSLSVLSYKEASCNPGGSWKKGNGYGNTQHHSYPHMTDVLEIWKPAKGTKRMERREKIGTTSFFLSDKTGM